MYRYCLRLCSGRRADAEDLAQETWLAAWRGLSGFRGHSSARTWVYTIALRKYVNRRSRHAEVSLEELTDQPPATSDTTLDSDLRLVLGEALEDLSDKLRQALILVKMEGLTSREAAEILGVPQGTVQYRVFTGLRELRKSLESRGVAAGVLLAPNLTRTLQQWCDSVAPAGLRPRVEEQLTLASAGPDVEVNEPQAGGHHAATPRQYSPRVAATVAAGAGGLLIIGAFGVFLLSRGAAHLPPSLRAAGQGMASVRTARAHTVTDVRGPDGNWVRRFGGKSYWFRSPSSIYSRSEIEPGRYAESYGNEREGVMISPETNGRRLRFPAPEGRSLSPFHALEPGGSISRLLRRSRTRVTVLRGSQARPEEVVIDQPEGPSPRRLTLTLDPRAQRLTRLETLTFTPTRTGWQPSERMVTRFEYDMEIPEEIFRFPPPESSAASIPGPRGSASGP